MTLARLACLLGLHVWEVAPVSDPDCSAVRVCRLCRRVELRQVDDDGWARDVWVRH